MLAGNLRNQCLNCKLHFSYVCWTVISCMCRCMHGNTPTCRQQLPCPSKHVAMLLSSQSHNQPGLVLVTYQTAYAMYVYMHLAM